MSHLNACTQYWPHQCRLMIKSHDSGFRSQLSQTASLLSTDVSQAQAHRLLFLPLYLICSLYLKLLFSLIKQEADGQFEAQVSIHAKEPLESLGMPVRVHANACMATHMHKHMQTLHERINRWPETVQFSRCQNIPCVQ